MEDRRVISRSTGEALAKEYNIPFMETSAKDGTGVEESFFALAGEVKRRLLDSPAAIAGVTGAGDGRRDPANVVLSSRPVDDRQSSGRCCGR
jgi:hypothetical protein